MSLKTSICANIYERLLNTQPLTLKGFIGLKRNLHPPKRPEQLNLWRLEQLFGVHSKLEQFLPISIKQFLSKIEAYSTYQVRKAHRSRFPRKLKFVRIS